MLRNRKLSNPSRIILAAMLGRRSEWPHGYELSKATGVGFGTLYPLLMRLEERGFLEARWLESSDGGRPPRHAYRLTNAGVELARVNPPDETRRPASNAIGMTS
ncbi:MAG: PadR family transcriptional regulator [Sphingomonadales bacterium]|nr:PadR family transcriptional regulator [Sphingomonadales bacterium]